MRQINRRELLVQWLGASAALALTTGCDRAAPSGPIAGELVGASADFGHRLRDQAPPRPSEDAWQELDVLVVGGGVAGLSAARRLVRGGVEDVRVLELEPAAGGTSRSGRSDRTAFPWGAHYLPVPLAHNRPLIELLNEIGVLEGEDEFGNPLGAEQHLCRAPQERVFYKGRWFEGLYLRAGASAEDLAELARFEQAINGWVAWRDARGRRGFTLPIAAASDDAEIAELDAISMADWLRRQNFRSSRLWWLVEYACRDDYGMTAADTSAWAGVFYFAARVPLPGVESQPFLTWPEGNGRLVRQLLAPVGDRLQTDQAVVDIAPPAAAAGGPDGRVAVVAVDRDGAARGYRARRVVFAAPRFLARHVIRPWREDPPGHLADFQYGSWMVANLHLSDRPAGRGFPLCWDNVLYESPSLGYVSATHQNDLDYGPTVLTYYYPLCQDSPGQERRRLLGMGQPEWAEVAVSDLQRAHPGLRPLVERVDVMRWGHAMVRPTIGFQFGAARRSAAEAFQGVHFAHSDLSGVPLFEEAFYQGNRAADEVLAALGHVSPSAL